MKEMLKWAAAMVLTAMSLTAALAQDTTHKLAIHIDENDPAVMNLALNNVQNVFSYYKEKGEKVVVEIVAYGPGLNMFVEDKSPVKDRISAMALEQPDLTFSACGNTLAGMTKKAGHEIKLMGEAVVVSAGVVRLMELDAEGYTYLKP